MVKPHASRRTMCLVETELKDQRDKFNKRNPPNTENLMKWEEPRRGHQSQQMNLLEVELKDAQHGHVMRAFDKDGFTKCICCGVHDGLQESGQKELSKSSHGGRNMVQQNRESQAIERHAGVHRTSPNTSRYSQGEACWVR